MRITVRLHRIKTPSLFVYNNAQLADSVPCSPVSLGEAYLLFCPRDSTDFVFMCFKEKTLRDWEDLVQKETT